MAYEYRVFAAFRVAGDRETVVNRPENPFYDRSSAEAFASRFTPPKFTRAWVERRWVEEWVQLP